MDFRYKAKVGKKWLKGRSLTDHKEDASEFESESEPTQIINQLKRDGKIPQKAEIKIVKRRESVNIEDIKRLGENLIFALREADNTDEDDDKDKEQQIENENNPTEEENPAEENQESSKENITSAPKNAQADIDAFKPTSIQNDRDETTTGVHKDSNLVAPNKIPPEEGECKIKFEKGEFSVGNMSPAVESKAQVVNNTILPLIEKAFIEGTGNSGTYRRLECNAVETNGKIDVDLVYHIDNFIGNDIDEASIIHDQNYIYNTIKVVPGINIRNIKIDTTTGNINIGVSL